MNVLELFSGTKSVGKVCDSLGWSSISVDLEMEADFKCDIMDFNYKQFDKDDFDIIWASPPCTYYSRLQYCWIGRKKKDGIVVTMDTIEAQRKEADKLLIRTFEIIDYFNCKWWFLENPYSSLKDREVMKDRFYHTVDYCKYSDWGYKKRTCIWTNKEEWTPLICNKDCRNLINNKHTKSLGNGYEMIDGKKVVCNTKVKRDSLRHKKVADGGSNRGNTLHSETDKYERYRIPPDLIYSLFLE